MGRFSARREGTGHAGWLGLIDVSGPFLSLPVLRRAWPSLDALDRPARERLRLAHTVFPRRPWIDYVLAELLGWSDLVHYEAEVGNLSMDVPTYDTSVTPSFALREPGAEADADAKTVRLLGLICDGHPHQRVKNSPWPATPVDRLAQLCRHHDVQLGLATDGRWWALVWTPRGGVTTTAVFDSVNWHEAAERDVVRAFVSILRRERFFGVPDEETLPALLRDSEGSQEDITEALGVQVRQAVELLVAAIGRVHAADLTRGGRGIGHVRARDVYSGAVAVMMRLIFVLYAEERGYLPADKPLYRASYSAGLLCSELERRARDGSEEDLEHTHAGWQRLLALFTAVYHGVDHPDMPIQGHDGSIFDADRYPWLPHTIDDRTVLHMLQAVQYVHIGAGRSRERRRLSFHSLNAEEIGYVYEGLLSADAFYADQPYLSLTGKAGLEEEVALSTLESIAARCPDTASLAVALAADYKKSGIGSPKALEKRLAPLSEAERQEAQRELLAVTRGDYPLAQRLLPFFRLIRHDLRGLPVVILTDALYVTESPLRKNTGTHYTPSHLAKEVVEGALEPLVYTPGPLQTANRKEWKLKSSGEILSLKVADIAMGSGAFLVAACRYLANHLVTAWINEDDDRARDRAGERRNPDFDADADPVVVNARRHIVEHCLYGADINEMAVEMAKLSLWLISMDPHKPFTFLDDRLITGDSLLGITSLDQLRVMHLDARRGREIHEDENALFSLTTGIHDVIDRVADQRRAITGMAGTDLHRLALKRDRLAIAESRTEHHRLLADLTVGAALAFARKGPTGLDTASKHALSAALRLMSSDEAAVSTVHENLKKWLCTDLTQERDARRPIHWPLALPEVFERGGFDAVIGNPPFLGGSKISGTLGTAYRNFIVQDVAEGASGNSDLVGYFLLQFHRLLNPRGQAALIATNTLGQGDTREVGLDRLTEKHVTLRQAIKSEPWPSKSALLEYSTVWTSLVEPAAAAEFRLDGAKVQGITPSLEARSNVSGRAHRLNTNARLSFSGTKVDGLGFTLPIETAKDMIMSDDRNKDVLFPYLNGQDISQSPDLSGSRWVINFQDWPLAAATVYEKPYERVCLLVKPQRAQNNRKTRRERWWQHAERVPGLYHALQGLERAIVITLVSKTVMPVMVPTGQVFSHMLGVFATDDTAMLALLSGGSHYWWTLSKASTLETRVRYTPSDVFETMPLPEFTQEMRESGRRLDGFRRDVMTARWAGLTKTYNMVHDPGCEEGDIVELRAIHREIDEAVCRAYGWDDLVPRLDHGHHPVGRERRYTVGPAVQRELVDRLLELNHERYAAEVAEGLHDRKSKRSSRRI